MTFENLKDLIADGELSAGMIKFDGCGEAGLFNVTLPFDELKLTENKLTGQYLDNFNLGECTPTFEFSFGINSSVSAKASDENKIDYYYGTYNITVCLDDDNCIEIFFTPDEVENFEPEKYGLSRVKLAK